MNAIKNRLQLLRQALVADRHERDERRRLEQELAGFSTPAERLEIETIVGRYDADEARTVQSILDRQSA